VSSSASFVRAEAASADEHRSSQMQRAVLLPGPAFYDRHGFEVVATIEDHPIGHRNLLM
jgi:hypothetical protein